MSNLIPGGKRRRPGTCDSNLAFFVQNQTCTSYCTSDLPPHKLAGSAPVTPAQGHAEIRKTAKHPTETHIRGTKSQPAAPQRNDLRVQGARPRSMASAALGGTDLGTRFGRPVDKAVLASANAWKGSRLAGPARATHEPGRVVSSCSGNPSPRGSGRGQRLRFISWHPIALRTPECAGRSFSNPST